MKPKLTIKRRFRPSWSCILVIVPAWFLAYFWWIDEAPDGSFLLQELRIENTAPPIIDVVSIGSELRPSFQDAQERNFAGIRYFYRITEADDIEKDCSHSLNATQLALIVDFCQSRRYRLGPHHKSLKRMTRHYARIQWLKKKENPTGWMCAQKRPSEGLYRVLLQNSTEYALPDYLLLVDDDTWVHLDVDYLRETYPPSVAHVIAGCMVRSDLRRHNFTIPFGGYGTIWTRAALERLRTPVDCRHVTTEFARLACGRLEEDPIGEAAVYQHGTSVLDWMHAYAEKSAYLEVDRWENVGFCLHSDWYIGYWVSAYFLGDPTGDPHFDDRLVAFKGSVMYAGEDIPGVVETKMGECAYKTADLCTPEATFCHYMKPVDMDRMKGLVG